MNTQEDVQVTTNDSIEEINNTVLQPRGLKVVKKLLNAGKRSRGTKSTASMHGKKDPPKQYYQESKELQSNDQYRITTITSSGGYSLNSRR